MSQDSNNSGNNFLPNLLRIAFDPNMLDFSLKKRKIKI